MSEAERRSPSDSPARTRSPPRRTSTGATPAWRPLAIAATLSAVALAIAFVAPPADAPPRLMTVAGLTVFTIGLWATDAVPEHLTALLFFWLASVLAVAPPEVVFSGFSSSAFWLVFGGLVLGVAAAETGLGAWIAAGLVERVAGSYSRLISAIVLGATALGFLVPSAMARCFILIPITVALARAIGFAPGSRGYAGMVLASTLGTFAIPANILSANLPNVLLAGAADKLYGITFSYTEFLLMHFPVAGLLKGLVLVGLICWRYPDRVPERPARETEPPRLEPAGRKLLLITLAALTLWMTDFAHGVSPGWIALLAAIVCLTPGVGLVGAESLRTRVSYPTLIFTAGVIGTGAVIAQSGLGAYVADLGLARLGLEPGATWHAFTTLTGLTLVLTLFATQPGTVALLTSLAGEAAALTGLSTETVLMTVVHGGGYILFPYQVGPVLVALKLAGLPVTAGVRILVPLTVISLLTLMPLTFGWWRLLGYL